MHFRWYVVRSKTSWCVEWTCTGDHIISSTLKSPLLRLHTPYQSSFPLTYTTHHSPTLSNHPLSHYHRYDMVPPYSFEEFRRSRHLRYTKASLYQGEWSGIPLFTPLKPHGEGLVVFFDGWGYCREAKMLSLKVYPHPTPLVPTPLIPTPITPIPITPIPITLTLTPTYLYTMTFCSIPLVS